MENPYKFFVEHEALGVAFVVLGVVFLGVAVVKTMQIIGFEKIRKEVYKAFLDAEYEFKHGDNEAKFASVVEKAQNALPFPFNLFITEKLLRKTIQLWFNLCKDLLDDGKMNGTGKEE